jgi:Uma2 family endonuclease
MASALKEKSATLEDLLREERKAELIGGKLVTFMPTGDEPIQAAFALAVSLRSFISLHKLPGLAVPDNAGFACDLPHCKSFSPDAAYYTGPRAGMRFYPEPPDFAAEIRSENDYGPAAEDALIAKRADYFAAGTLVVWDVDLLGEEIVIRKFTAESGAETPGTTFTRRQLADAEPAVPGWKLPVSELFV